MSRHRLFVAMMVIPTAVSASLYAHFSFDTDLDGAMTATDDSGNSQVATCYGSAWSSVFTTGFAGNALHLNNPSAYDNSWASSSYSKLMGPTVTEADFGDYVEIEFYFKVESFTTCTSCNDETLLSFGTADTVNVDYNENLAIVLKKPSNGGTLSLRTPGSSAASFITTSIIGDDTWHHLVFAATTPCASSSTVSAILDGTHAQNITNVAASSYFCDQAVMFNHHRWNSGYSGSSRINMKIDEFKMYTSPRTPTTTATATSMPTSSNVPTSLRTNEPTSLPSSLPTNVPTSLPTNVPMPSFLPSAEPTALPSVSPIQMPTPKPSAFASQAPTMNTTMTRITEISSSYVMTPKVKAEIVYADEIYLNGVVLSSSNRRLLQSSDVISNGAMEELRREMLDFMEKQQAMNDALKATNEAQQTAIEILKARLQARDSQSTHSYHTQIAPFSE